MGTKTVSTTDNMVCTVCGCEDEASYFLANLGYCPSCGEEATVRRAKQVKFDKLRCSVKELEAWKKSV